MLCPACKVELKMADRQGIEIDYCPQCRGVWLDRGELDKIIERSAVAAPPPPQAPPPPMPQRTPDYHYKDDDSDWGQRSWSDRGNYGGKPYKKKSLLGEIFDF